MHVHARGYYGQYVDRMEYPIQMNACLGALQEPDLV